MGTWRGPSVVLGTQVDSFGFVALAATSLRSRSNGDAEKIDCGEGRPAEKMDYGGRPAETQSGRLQR